MSSSTEHAPFRASVHTVARLAVVSLLLASAIGPARAQSANPVKKAGKYAVELRVPVEGLYAEEETDVELRVTDTGQDDSVQGAPPVVNAKIEAVVTMPVMPGMPKQTPRTHSEGVPGDYGVVLYFPHGGEYQIDLTITPPGDQPFTVSFKVPVNDPLPAGKRKPRPQPYTLEVTSDPPTPRAGEPANLTIVVRDRATKQPVTDFDIVHEQKMHFIVVSKDLSFFSHEHPHLGEGGKLTLRYTFPSGGEYRLFADTAPHGAGSLILMQPIKVTGPTSNNVPALPLTPTSADAVGGTKIALKTNANQLNSGRTLPLTFSLLDEKTGRPVTDIQPWLGAIAHLILIHQDGTTFVHSHPDESDPANGKTGSMVFLGRFPKPGLYRGWLQFQEGGQVKTATFVVRAKERS